MTTRRRDTVSVTTPEQLRALGLSPTMEKACLAALRDTERVVFRSLDDGHAYGPVPGFDFYVDDSLLRRDAPAPAAGTVRLDFPIESRAFDPEKRSVEVVCSTTAIDAWGEIVVQDWNLRRAHPSISLLYNHDSWGLPIGKGTQVRVEDNKLKATITFASEKANPKAEQVWNLWKEECIRSISVGFRPSKRLLQTIDGVDVVHLVGNELLEISVVTIPANPEAVALSLKALAAIPLERSAPANVNDVPAPDGTGHEKEMPMPLVLVTLAAICGLPTNATEEDVETSIRSMRRTEADIAELTGKKSPGEGLAIVRGWKQSHDALPGVQARVKELELGDEKRERSAIIEKLKSEKKLSPAMVTWAETQPIGALKAFAEVAPPIPTLAADPATPPDQKSAVTGPLTADGKGWKDLTPEKKHDLYFQNRPLYDAMKAAAERPAA